MILVSCFCQFLFKRLCVEVDGDIVNPGRLIPKGLFNPPDFLRLCGRKVHFEESHERVGPVKPVSPAVVPRTENDHLFRAARDGIRQQPVNVPGPGVGKKVSALTISVHSLSREFRVLPESGKEGVPGFGRNELHREGIIISDFCVRIARPDGPIDGGKQSRNRCFVRLHGKAIGAQENEDEQEKYRTAKTMFRK